MVLVYACIALVYLPFILPLMPHPIVGMIVFIVLAMVPFIFLERVRVIKRHGSHCQHCGYNLTGLAESNCPECGERF